MFHPRMFSRQAERLRYNASDALMIEYGGCPRMASRCRASAPLAGLTDQSDSAVIDRRYSCRGLCKVLRAAKASSVAAVYDRRGRKAGMS
jgi:hypothetical protein